MAVDELSAGTWGSHPGRANASRRETIVLVRWALIIACSYLILFSEGSSGALGFGPVVIAIFLGSNLVIGRLSPDLIETQQFSITIVVVDTLLIIASLYFAGQLLVELIVLCLGVLFLAVAGLRLSSIAAVTLGMTLAYLVIVALSGGESLWRSSMLLRVPFLLCAAIVYAWVTDGKRLSESAQGAQGPSDVSALRADLSVQLEAIRHCQTAISDGSLSAARTALDEVTAHNQMMQAKLADLQSKAVAAHVSPAVARNAA